MVLSRSPRLSGKDAESLACRYLEARGLVLIRRNYRSHRGEIDLIMRDSQDLVFIEVKYRHSNLFGGPEEAITAVKEQRLKITAARYLQETRCPNAMARFDAVAMSQPIDANAGYSYNWIKNIFH